MTRNPKTGGEIDSWCTKCRLILNHRIIAMVGTKPVRVECSTCGSHHNYRPRAPGEKSEPVARAGASGASSSRASSSASSSRGAGASRGPTRAEQARMSREQTWEKAIAGHAISDFRRYSVAATFAEGDLIHHAKFGDGVVVRVIDAAKIEILFKDDSRTLAQGMVD